MILDGALIELTVTGEYMTQKYSWWTIPPEGYEAVKTFCDWLYLKVPEISPEND